MIFAVENGWFSYDKQAAAEDFLLRGVSFSVRRGELMAVLGPNGAGKTTLLRCMMGFLPWSQGRSTLDGADIRAIPHRRLWQRLAYVPQARGVNSSYTVEELVLLGRSSHFGVFAQPGEEDKRAARAALEQLNIAHLAKRPAGAVSGGELQMALIARALAAAPELLILDEPESNLDFKNQLIIMETLCSLARSGIACVFNTHYPTHALQRADLALLLDKQGRQVFGPAGQVITEENIAAAFGVAAVISEVETKHNILKNVLPLQVLTMDMEKNKLPEPAVPATKEGKDVDTRLAIIGVIIEDRAMAERINALLHEYGGYIVGRMGMPYEKKQLSIISVIVDAPEDVISSLSGKLGMLPGVSAKTTYSKR